MSSAWHYAHGFAAGFAKHDNEPALKVSNQSYIL